MRSSVGGATGSAPEDPPIGRGCALPRARPQGAFGVLLSGELAYRKTSDEIAAGAAMPPTPARGSGSSRISRWAIRSRSNSFPDVRTTSSSTGRSPRSNRRPYPPGRSMAACASTTSSTTASANASTPGAMSRVDSARRREAPSTSRRAWDRSRRQRISSWYVELTGDCGSLDPGGADGGTSRWRWSPCPRRSGAGRGPAQGRVPLTRRFPMLGSS